jgi:transposase, IS5 family
VRGRPRTVSAERGYGEARVEDDLCGLGVCTVVIPGQAEPTSPEVYEHRRGFRRTVQWRIGARIRTVKRQYG